MRPHAALLDREPLQFRDKQQHLVFKRLRLDIWSIRSEAHAKAVQRAQNFRIRDRFVSHNIVKKHKLRNHKRPRRTEKQPQHKKPPSPEPAERLSKAHLPHDGQLAHRLPCRGLRLQNVLSENQKRNRKIIDSLHTQKRHARI